MLGQWFPDSGAERNISFHIFATHQTGKNVTRQYFNNLTSRSVCKSSRSYVMPHIKLNKYLSLFKNKNLKL
jgi:hypothetical protein